MRLTTHSRHSPKFYLDSKSLFALKSAVFLNRVHRKKRNHVFVNVSFALLALSGSAIAMTAIALPLSASEPTVIELQGQCDYREQVRESALPGTGFALCNAVRIEENSTASAIDFRNSLGGSEFRYEGTWSGDGMTISRLSFKGRTPKDASGNCRIFRNAGNISTVTCIAKIDGNSFAANFVASRINP